MGNRATIIFVHSGEISPAIYLHWNGGAESIYPFLEELEKRGGGGPGGYESARFIQVVGDFFDQKKRDTMSIGVNNGPYEIGTPYLKAFDPGNNGIFVIETFYKDYKMQQRIRRFSKASYDKPLREWSEEEVEREKISALKHPYNEGIREEFREIDRKLYSSSEETQEEE